MLIFGRNSSLLLVCRCLCRSLRTKPFQRLILYLAVSMIFVLLFTATAGEPVKILAACKAHGFVLHFSLLVMFGLMTVASLSLYVSLVHPKLRRGSGKIERNCVIVICKLVEY